MFQRTLLYILCVIIVTTQLTTGGFELSLSDESVIINGDFIITDKNGETIVLPDVFDEGFVFTGGFFEGIKDTLPMDSITSNEKIYDVPLPEIINGDLIIVKDGQTLILEGVFPKDFKPPTTTFTGIKK
ncbi:MAG: hypothetical protein JXR88_13115 [Clostridia bacterium]|nr:hypothetical protein [Clostridia bacterium]